MDIALHASRNGIFATTDKQSLIATNLANIDTPAFKRVRQIQADFRFPGTQVATTQPDFSQGNIAFTGRELDIAIDGDGFFRVLAGGVESYSRAGALHVDTDGNLVTAQGYFVEPAITVPPDALRVNVRADGTVVAITDASGTTQELGQLEAVRFQNNVGLIPFGDSLWLEGPDSGPPLAGNFGQEGYPVVRGGHLEESNVDLAVELTDELVTQRTFQANIRAYEATDAIIRETINLVR
jgi:flagellar basal-body rod protein FlgG